MPQDDVVMLLRQISSSLPGDPREMPDEMPDLSLAQIYLLAELFKLEKAGNVPLSLSALAQQIGFSKATVCATLKKLRKAGYIQMPVNEADNRRKEILLTSEAWKVESRITGYISQLDQALCAGISQKDLQTVEKSLWVILQNAKKVRAASS